MNNNIPALINQDIYDFKTNLVHDFRDYIGKLCTNYQIISHFLGNNDKNDDNDDKNLFQKVLNEILQPIVQNIINNTGLNVNAKLNLIWEFYENDDNRQCLQKVENLLIEKVYPFIKDIPREINNTYDNDTSKEFTELRNNFDKMKKFENPNDIEFKDFDEFRQAFEVAKEKLFGNFNPDTNNTINFEKVNLLKLQRDDYEKFFSMKGWRSGRTFIIYEKHLGQYYQFFCFVNAIAYLNKLINFVDDEKEEIKKKLNKFKNKYNTDSLKISLSNNFMTLISDIKINCNELSNIYKNEENKLKIFVNLIDIFNQLTCEIITNCTVDTKLYLINIFLNKKNLINLKQIKKYLKNNFKSSKEDCHKKLIKNLKNLINFKQKLLTPQIESVFELSVLSTSNEILNEILNKITAKISEVATYIKNNTLEQQNQQLTTDKTDIKTEINTLKTENYQLKEQNKQFETLNQQIEQLTTEKNNLEKQKTDLETEINTLKTENYQLKEQNKQFETLNQQIEQLKNENQQLKNENQQLTTKNQQLTTEKNELDQKNQQLTTEKNELDQKNQQLKNENQQLTTKNQQLINDKTKQTNLAEQIEKLTTKNQQLTTEKNELDQKNQQLINEQIEQIEQFKNDSENAKLNKIKKRFATTGIVLGVTLIVSAITLGVLTFGVGTVVLGAVATGLTLGIPAVTGAISIIAGAICYKYLDKRSAYTEINDSSGNSDKEEKYNSSPNSLENPSNLEKPTMKKGPNILNI